MRLFYCSAIVAFACLANGQKKEPDDDKFSIGLGVLAPSYRQKVGTGKELGAQIDYNQEGKGFSYTVSQGDPSSGKPYSSIQISRPAPSDAPVSAPRQAPPTHYQPPPQYSAPAPAPQAPRYVSAPQQYQPPPQQYQPPQQQYQPAPAAVPQYLAGPPSAPQYAQPVQYQPRPQYAPSAGVQYAPQYAPSAVAAPQYRPQYQPSNLPQVAPQPFGASGPVSQPQYNPRYQSAPSAYPNALAAPQTYNAPSSAAQPAAAPQYVPPPQNVRYQYGSGAEPAFASHLSIFGQQNAGRQS